ncbi:MAG: D-alanyl-D-alanine carboxypeptidase, partial [Clostridia bacterium]|nr:D-alanyl-D-alanine carboxypeptidase [Clostridia bacterium]
EKQSIRKEINLAENVQAPVKKGDIIGELVVYKDDQVHKTYPLVCEKDIEKAGIFSLYFKIFKNIV